MAHNGLAAVTTTGAGATIKMTEGVSEHSYQVNITGAPTAVTVDLEGSLDGSTWFQLDQHAMSAGELTDTASLTHVTGKLAEYIRMNLTTLTGGASPTVTGRYLGY
jgi:hypothetical protein